MGWEAGLVVAAVVMSWHVSGPGDAGHHGGPDSTGRWSAPVLATGC